MLSTECYRSLASHPNHWHVIVINHISPSWAPTPIFQSIFLIRSCAASLLLRAFSPPLFTPLSALVSVRNPALQGLNLSPGIEEILRTQLQSSGCDGHCGGYLPEILLSAKLWASLIRRVPNNQRGILQRTWAESGRHTSCFSAAASQRLRLKLR